MSLNEGNPGGSLDRGAVIGLFGEGFDTSDPTEVVPDFDVIARWAEYNVADYGAVGDGTADDTAEIQQAIDDAAAAGGGIIRFPALKYKVSGLTIDSDRLIFQGSSRTDSSTVGAGTILMTGSGANALFSTDADRKFVVFRDMRLWSSSGASGNHVFDFGGGVSFWTWERCRMGVTKTDKSIINLAAGETFIDNRMVDCWLKADSNSWTVPVVNLPSTLGTVNSNTFERLRCEHSGNYFFYLAESEASNYTSDNVFRDITFEITNGGNIKILSGRNNVIENCNTYDLSGATTKDLYYIGASASGPDSLGNTIRTSSRRGGSLGGSLYDIKLPSGESTYTRIDTCNGAMDFGNNYVVSVNLLSSDSPAATVANKSAASARAEVPLHIGSQFLVRRTADATPITADTSPNSDDTLLWAVAANEVWLVEAFLRFFSDNATMDIKLGWSVPSGAAMSWGAFGGLSSEVASFGARVATTSPLAELGAAGTLAVGSLNATSGIALVGFVENGATPGDVTLQWSQNTSDAGQLYIRKHSLIRATRLA